MTVTKVLLLFIHVYIKTFHQQGLQIVLHETVSNPWIPNKRKEFNQIDIMSRDFTNYKLQYYISLYYISYSWFLNFSSITRMIKFRMSFSIFNISLLCVLVWFFYICQPFYPPIYYSSLRNRVSLVICIYSFNKKN